MTKIRNKKYNPNKLLSQHMPIAHFMPLLGPLDILSGFLKRGYLTDNEVRCNDDMIPTQYHLCAFLYQHTFLISSIKRAQNDPIVRYIKSIQSVLEKYLLKVLCDTVQQDNKIFLPHKITIGKLGLAKILWFIENSKRALYNLTKQEYTQAVKDGSANHMIKLQIDINCPIRYFIDMESSNKFLEGLLK